MYNIHTCLFMALLLNDLVLVSRSQLFLCLWSVNTEPLCDPSTCPWVVSRWRLIFFFLLIFFNLNYSKDQIIVFLCVAENKWVDKLFLFNFLLIILWPVRIILWFLAGFWPTGPGYFLRLMCVFLKCTLYLILACTTQSKWLICLDKHHYCGTGYVQYLVFYKHINNVSIWYCTNHKCARRLSIESKQ